MEKRQKPLLVRVGCELTIFKLKEGGDDMTNFLTTSITTRKIDEIVGTPKKAILEGEDRAFEGYMHICITLNVSTKNLSVYTPETMKASVLSLETELKPTNDDTIEKVKGSGWSMYRFNKMYSVLHTNKTARADSYIKTPENIIVLNVV